MKKYNLLIFNIMAILFMDIVFKIFVFKDVFNVATLFMISFDITIALFITILESLFKNTIINRIISIFFTFILWLLICAQFIYFQYYDAIFSIYSLFHGAQVFGFIDSIISVILQNIIVIIILSIPFIFFLIFIKKWNVERRTFKFITILLVSLLIIYAGTILCLNNTDKNKTYSMYNLYYNTHVPKLTVRDFGVINEMRLDLKRTLFGFEEKLNILNNEEEEKVNIIEEVKYHTFEINFDELIKNEKDDTLKSMHEYFDNQNATSENEYTGLFKDKNLIVIVAEAFSPMAINETLTPTLYKLYSEGFQFDNFYTPVFYVSTSDGEYVTLTSLLPKDGTWSMSVSSDNYLPFAYGNLFKNYGYTTRAYHDGSYAYYNRHNSLPNMGYNYKACYGGLDINCNVWPQSDIEMMEASVKEYINDEKFMTYYMTVSGHLNYTYTGNSIATKNKDYVIDLPYSEAIQAYLATQIELDRAVENLIKQLEESERLDDTVIAISADHYPYGLTNEQILEYATYVDDEKFDIHKNSFLLWNNTINKSIKVTKYASSLDILPTILNLFDVGYDSRLFMGKDILSDEEGLVIFNDRSWISSYGKYNAVTEEFTPYKDNIEENYVDNINNKIYNKFLMSKLILEKDYYSKIIDKDFYKNLIENNEKESLGN